MKARREGDIAQPIDRGRSADAALLQFEIGPDGAEDTERYGDQEHQAPTDSGQQPAEHQSDKRAADPGHVVYPQGKPTLIGGEGIGEDRGRVGDQKGGAHPLHDPERDEPDRPGRPSQPVNRQEQRGDSIDHKAQVVHAYSTEEIAEPAEADHQHAAHYQIAEDHPEKKETVAGGQGIEMDAAEDDRHGDQHDRGVDGCQQDAQPWCWIAQPTYNRRHWDPTGRCRDSSVPSCSELCSAYRSVERALRLFGHGAGGWQHR